MAAAYGALVSLLNDLVDIQNHPQHSFSFDSNQIQSLRESVNFLIDFMESYDNCHGPSKEAAQLLEMRITRAAYEAEEVIESHLVDQIRVGKTATHFPPDLHEIIEGVDCVRREAVEVQAQAQSGLKLKQQPIDSAAAASSSTPMFTSEKNSMVGFDEVLLQLLDLLTGKPSSQRVIPIVGTGGIGKTTLAKNAFEHPLIVESFDVCVWATISQQYVVQDILSKLLSHQGKSNDETVGELGSKLLSHQGKSNDETVGELGNKLYKSLFGRKYLIVLDDVWSVKSWEDVKVFFPDTKNGSRVVVTTRQSDVAYDLSSSSIAMSYLDDEESWDLFCQKAFAGQGCPPELEEVGKKIVRKCQGLPLAIVVVAGHLGKSSRMEEYWESVANNMNSILSSEENKHLLDVLSFSYSHLPVHLKPCFVFMGMLLEDEEISALEITQRWIAEGYVKPNNADDLQEIAYGYLHNLFDRNLILYKNSRKVGIHDILRELCLKIAEEEMFFCVLDTPRAICREGQVDTTPLVRSLIWPEGEGEVSLDLRLLRVLYMFDNVDESFIETNLEQVNLRCLIYRRVETERPSFHLSPSISLLWNLQTLIIYGGYDVSCIAPDEIWEMLQLRHLDVRSRIHLPCDQLDQRHLVMRNLRTLKRVKNFKMSEEVCRKVPNILKLDVLYNGFDVECDEVRSYYCPHNLGSFSKLESLACQLGWDSKWRKFALCLTFPSSLKQLLLANLYLQWEEMAMMVGSLPHLETLLLEGNSVIGSEWNPVEGKFLRLKNLSICNCEDLIHWNAHNTCFPVLKYLYLSSLYRLDEFPSGIGEITTLRSIFLKNCKESSVVSAVRVVVEQVEEFGNEDLRLRVCINDDEDRKRFMRKVEEEGLNCLTTKNLRVDK